MTRNPPAEMVCPDRAALEAYARDQLSPESASGLDKHLPTCRFCFQQFVGFVHRSSFPAIPDCHIVKEIGRGRFGVVYKAWWFDDAPRLIALKVLGSKGTMETVRFDREIAVLQKLDSPGIVKCLYSGATGDNKYYLMEFVDGVHLDEYLSLGVRGLNDQLAIFQAVCQAVADAHAEGVVHRDLKPKNILVDQRGQPRILDFGICTVEAQDWTSWARYTVTQPGDVIGTLKYMSPEQAWGGVAEPVSERSDIWALGIMLHEIVTGGGYPYATGSTRDKPTHEALLDRIRRELPRLPRLTSVPRGRDLETMLERCLAWEPDRRLDSAAKLADDLERYRRGSRIETKPFSLRYRMRRYAVGAAIRSRWVFWLVFFALLASALQAGTYLFRIGWHVTGGRYQHFSMPGPGAVGEGSARDDMLVIGISDDTVGPILNFAREHQYKDVTSDTTGWRALHGYGMERLATVRPWAVVWDYYFRSEQPTDAELVAGIRRLEKEGVPVILASASYSETGEPDLSPALTDSFGRLLRHGAIAARDMVAAPGEFVIALRRSETAVIPSVALVTLSAVLHPEARLELEWPDRGASLSALYEMQPKTYLRERDKISYTRAAAALEDKFPLRKGDLQAVTTFSLEPPEIWATRTWAYESLLTCSDEELHARAAGKLILFGDLRTMARSGVHDRHRVRYGNTIQVDVPGCYLLADSIAGLLDRRYLRAAFPLATRNFLALMAAGALGCLVPVVLLKRSMLDRQISRRIAWATLAAMIAASAVIATQARNVTAVYLGMATFSLFAPMAGSLWVELARNRHRVLDAARAALDGMASPETGTITLAEPPERSRP